MLPIREPVAATTAPESTTNSGPYGAGVSRQMYDMVSSHGQGSVETPYSYGLMPPA